MDYNIKVKYDGAGKQFASARQRVIQAQKAAEKKGTTTPIGANRDLLNSIQKLIDSNKKLERAILKISGTGLGGGGGGGSSGLANSGSGIGRIGAGIGMGVGGGIAAIGFAIQKINQVGNAYIQLAGQQIGTVGMGGFRTGRGVYGSAEMGAGMAAYAKGTGKFARGPARMVHKTYRDEKNILRTRSGYKFSPGVDVDTENMRAIRNIGAVYGMSASEVYGQAGTFKRAGGDYAKAAAIATDAGIQSDMPILLSGMANILEEAIRNGLDTSEMSKDLEKGFLSLTRFSPTKSVESAMSIVKTFRSVSGQVAAGKFGSYEGMKAAQASRNILMRNLGNEKYVQNLLQKGIISEDQAKKIQGMGKGATYTQLQKTIGNAGALSLLTHTASTAKDAEILKESMRITQGQFGSSTEAKQKAYFVYKGLGGVLQQQQYYTAWDEAKSPELKYNKAKGMKTIKTDARATLGSSAGMAKAKMQMEEGMLLKHGPKFAEVSFLLEKNLLSLAEGAVPYLGKALKEIADLLRGDIKSALFKNALQTVIPGGGIIAGKIIDSYMDNK